MSGRFMRVRSIVLPFMTAVILVSQLTGCASLNSQEMMEELEKNPEIQIEYNELDTGQNNQNDNAIQVGDTQYSLDFSGISDNQEESGTSDISEEGSNESEPDLGVLEEDNTQELAELSGDALTSYFQKAYDMGSILEGDIETRIETELGMVSDLVTQDGTGRLPDDYESQYRSWRPVEVKELFTDTNETVYATGTVNIRESYSSDSTKLGSLSVGQSVTRTGVGKEEASGWSRVTLSDGRTAYINNSYLSTTKPVVQQQQNISKPAQSNGGGTTQQTPPKTETPKTPTTPSQPKEEPPAPAPDPTPSQPSGGDSLWAGLDFGGQHLPGNNEAAGGHTEGWTAQYH